MNAILYKVLLIGCGNIAGGFDMSRASHLPPLSHAGGYIQHGGFRLSACVDPDDGRRQTFAKYWGVETQATKLEELCVSPGAFDVISICSPTAFHQEHLEYALALRPRVIFCEKPLTLDLGAAAAAVRNSRLNGVTLLVNYSRRWDPSVAELAAQLQSGRWGVVRSVVGHYNKGIQNNGGHMVDLLQRLFGSLKLVATACPQFDFWDSDPTVAALLTARKGTLPVYLNPAHARDFAFFELEIVCELGVIRMQSGGIDWQFRGVIPNAQFNGYFTIDTAKRVDGRYVESMERAIDEIYAFLHGGKPPEGSGDEALRVQELCAQIQHEGLMKRKSQGGFDE